MKIVEKILWAILILAIISRLVASKAIIIVALAGLCLSVFYMFFTVLLLNQATWSYKNNWVIQQKLQPLRFTATIFLGFLYASLAVAVTFTALSWPGSVILLILSFIGLLISSAIIIYKANQAADSNSFYKQIKFRNICLTLTALTFIFIWSMPADIVFKIFPLNKKMTERQNENSLLSQSSRSVNELHNH